jgi:hypothetical protein
MNDARKSGAVLTVAMIFFMGLAALFANSAMGHYGRRLPAIPLIDPKFVDPAPSRVSIAEALRSGADASDYDCYICHERNKPLKITLDTNGIIVLPKEHSDIKMAHGGHNRNNNCFNCHDETNLAQLQTRDGRQLKLTENTAPLCGSCHGPTYRDWEAGAHGRTSGTWNHEGHEIGPPERLACPSCHNPHSPKFPSRTPAPGPHPLHPVDHALVDPGKLHP